MRLARSLVAWAVAALAATAFEGGRARADDPGASVSFASDAGVAVLPFENVGGLVVVPVRVGDSRPPQAWAPRRAGTSGGRGPSASGV